MARTKRTSSDSLMSHMARRDVNFPKHVKLPPDEALADEVLACFADIISGRRASDWSKAELNAAANLAVAQTFSNMAQSDIFERGLTVEKEGSKGQIVTVSNPNSDLFIRFSSLVGTLSSKLSVYAGSTIDKTSIKRHGEANPAVLDKPPSGEKKTWKDRPQ